MTTMKIFKFNNKLNCWKIFLFFIATTVFSSCSSSLVKEKHYGDEQSLVFNEWGTPLAFLSTSNIHFSEQFQKMVSNQDLNLLVNYNESQWNNWLKELTSKIKDRSPEEKKYLGRDLYVKGNILQKSGELKKASQLFNFMLASLSRESEIFLNDSISHLYLGDLTEAYKSLTQVLTTEVEPNKIMNIQMILASLSDSRSDFLRAENHYRAALKIKDGDNYDEICIKYGELLIKQKKYSEFRDLKNRCEVIAYNSLISLSLLEIKDAFQKGEFEKGTVILKKISEKFPGNAALTNVIIDFQEYLKPQKLINIDKVLHEYFSRGNMDFSVINKMTDYFVLKQRYIEARQVLEKILPLYPQNQKIKMRLAMLYMEEKKWIEAESTLRSCLTDNTADAQTYFHLYSTLKIQGKTEEGIAYLEKVDQTDPNYSQILNERGDYFREKWKLSSDLKLKEVNLNKWEDFLKSSRPRPESDHFQTWMIQSVNYYDSIGKADVAAQMLIELDKSYGLKEHQKYYLATILEELNKRDEAEQIIRKLIEANPSFAHGWNFLAYSYLERDESPSDENLKIAFSLVQKAIKIAPNDPYIVDTLGKYYFKKGEFKKALTHFEFSFGLLPNDYAIVSNLVQAYLALNMVEKAESVITLLTSKDNILSLEEKKQLELLVPKGFYSSTKQRIPASQDMKDVNAQNQTTP